MTTQHGNRMPIDMLIKLLQQYSALTFNHEECVAFVTGSYGDNYSTSIEGACGMAADELARRDIEAFKFRVLVKGLESHRCGHLYEMIMGQPIEKAIL